MLKLTNQMSKAIQAIKMNRKYKLLKTTQHKFQNSKIKNYKMVLKLKEELIPLQIKVLTEIKWN